MSNNAKNSIPKNKLEYHLYIQQIIFHVKRFSDGYIGWVESNTRDLCKTPSFAHFLCLAQILILKILNIFLWLKFSPSLNLNKIEHFSRVSTHNYSEIIWKKLSKFVVSRFYKWLTPGTFPGDRCRRGRFGGGSSQLFYKIGHTLRQSPEIVYDLSCSSAHTRFSLIMSGMGSW